MGLSKEPAFGFLIFPILNCIDFCSTFYYFLLLHLGLIFLLFIYFPKVKVSMMDFKYIFQKYASTAINFLLILHPVRFVLFFIHPHSKYF